MSYARLSTRNTSGLHPNLRAYIGGLSFLGDNSTGVTASDALAQAQSGYSSPDFNNSAWEAAALQDVVNMQMLLIDPTCGSAPGGSPLGLVSAAGGMALQDTGAIAASVGSSIASAIPIVGAVFSTIVGIFGIFSAHHRAAVAQEEKLQCSLVPAANNYLNVIAQAVQNGVQTPEQGSAALDSLLSDFTAAAQPSFQNNPCNAMCEWTVVLKAIVIYWKAQYAQMAAQAAAVAAESVAQSQTLTPAPTAAQSQAADLDSQAAALNQQAAAAQANGNPTTAAALTVQANALTSQAAKVRAAGAVPATGLSAIPTWAWLAAAALAAWAVL